MITADILAEAGEQLTVCRERVVEVESENTKLREQLREMLQDRYLQVETLLNHHCWGGPDKEQLQRLHDALLMCIAELEER